MGSWGFIRLAVPELMFIDLTSRDQFIFPRQSKAKLQGGERKWTIYAERASPLVSQLLTDSLGESLMIKKIFLTKV